MSGAHSWHIPQQLTWQDCLTKVPCGRNEVSAHLSMMEGNVSSESGDVIYEFLPQGIAQ
jgi:hypothetical protein